MAMMAAAADVEAPPPPTTPSNEPLPLVLAAEVAPDDNYYGAQCAASVRAFAEHLQTAAPPHTVTVLTRTAAQPPVAAAAAAVRDVWLRDFAPVQFTGATVVQFRYQPSYLGRREARRIQEPFARWVQQALGQAMVVESPLVLDGGNVVLEPGAGSPRCVVTERVLRDNPGQTEASVGAALVQLGAAAVCVIPEEPGDSTGHADGMVAWLAPGVLAVNQLDQAGSGKRLHQTVRERLRAAFGDSVLLVDLPYHPTNQSWRGFADASGDYANIVVLQPGGTALLPSFGADAQDAAAAEDAAAAQVVAAHAAGAVIPVDCSRVARMGGAVRCLTWSVYGTVADRLRAHLGL